MSEYTQLNYESEDDTTNQKSSGKISERKNKQIVYVNWYLHTNHQKRHYKKSKNSEATVNWVNTKQKKISLQSRLSQGSPMCIINSIIVSFNWYIIIPFFYRSRPHTLLNKWRKRSKTGHTRPHQRYNKQSFDKRHNNSKINRSKPWAKQENRYRNSHPYLYSNI